jgi:hypothetical protein
MVGENRFKKPLRDRVYPSMMGICMAVQAERMEIDLPVSIRDIVQEVQYNHVKPALLEMLREDRRQTGDKDHDSVRRLYRNAKYTLWADNPEALRRFHDRLRTICWGRPKESDWADYLVTYRDRPIEK